MTIKMNGPAIALVDDDQYAASQMVRCLGRAGASAMTTYASARQALGDLAALVADDLAPDMVIVDLKSSSRATEVFVATLSDSLPSLLVVAMAPTLDRALREKLLRAGAAAVFERCADLKRFQSETDAIVEFWRREGVAYEMALAVA